MRKTAGTRNSLRRCSTLGEHGQTSGATAPDGPNIRPQYHFRRVNGQTHIWDVRKLIALVSDRPVFDLPLDQIGEIDETYWFDGTGPVPTCRAVLDHMRLVEAADLQWPILLCPNLRVMDGMHRVMKAVHLGNATISARCLRELPAPDFIDVSADDLEY